MESDPLQPQNTSEKLQEKLEKLNNALGGTAVVETRERPADASPHASA